MKSHEFTREFVLLVQNCSKTVIFSALNENWIFNDFNFFNNFESQIISLYYCGNVWKNSVHLASYIANYKLSMLIIKKLIDCLTACPFY